MNQIDETVAASWFGAGCHVVPRYDDSLTEEKMKKMARDKRELLDQGTPGGFVVLNFQTVSNACSIHVWSAKDTEIGQVWGSNFDERTSIVESDIQASNGTLHIIKGYLL